MEWEKVTLTINHEPFQFQAFSVHIDFLVNKCETAEGCCSFVLNFLQSTNSTVVYQLSTLHQTKYEGNVESLVSMTMSPWPWSKIPKSISNLMPFGVESLVLVMNCKSTYFLCVPIAQRNSHKLFDFWSASHRHIRVFPLLPERKQKLRTQIVYNGSPKFLGRLLYAYLHPLLGADELRGSSWQLATAVCDEGDGLSLCEQLSWGYDLHSLSCYLFLLLWRLLCNFIKFVALIIVDSNRCRCWHDGTIRRNYIAYLENTLYTSIIPTKE